MKALFPLILLLLSNPEHPDGVKDPVITITSRVEGEVGDFLFIEAKAKGTVKFYTPDKNLKFFPQALLKDPKTLIVYSKVPGTYRLYAWTSQDNEPSDLVFCTIVVTGPPVPPTPIPPGPTPPGPVTKLIIVGVYDPVRLTPVHAAILNDIKFWDSISARGHTVKIWDKNSSEAQAVNVPAQVTKFGVDYPALVFAKPSGEVLKAFKLPTTKAGIESLIKDLGGL